VFDGSRLVVSLFNNQFAIVETQMGAAERFIKKSNYTLYQLEGQENQPLAVDLRLHKGLMISYHLHFVKIWDFQSMTVTDGTDLGAGTCPNSLITLNPNTDEVSIARKVN
jgi:hypothetical protein